MAALRLDESPKGDPLLPVAYPDTAHQKVSLEGKPSASAPSQEPQTIKATDLSVESILENPPTSPSLRMQSTNDEDKEDLEFLDNLLDAESTSTKPTTIVEQSEKRDLDDEEWLDEFLGD